jgi:hypothetical protein
MPIEFGGKLLSVTGYGDGSPSLVYPSTDPIGAYFGDPTESYFGSVGNSATEDSGLTERIAGALPQYAIPHFIVSGKKYIEWTIKSIKSGWPQNGFSTMAVILYANIPTGQDGTFPPLGPSDQVAAYGNNHTDFSPQVGDVIGFLIDFDNGTAEVKLNNVSLKSISSINTTVPWTIKEQMGNVVWHVNVGQEAFVYSQSGYSDWSTP